MSRNASHSTLSKTMSETSKSASSFKESLTGGSEGLDYQALEELDSLARLERDKTGYYYLGYKYARPTRKDYERKQLKGGKLFEKEEHAKKTKDDETAISEIKKKDASILVTGFGMRNLDSFQRILRMSEEEREKAELRKLWRDKKEAGPSHQYEEAYDHESKEGSSFTDRSQKSTSDFITQTETTIKSFADDQKRQLEYLMGLDQQAEEEPEPTLEFPEKEEPAHEQYPYSTSKSMREAQKYLRTHRIFEFFQFIVAHMLSAKADSPIEFMLNLLNQCLLYRSGLGAPPLLYSKPHIEQLFYLMDRLKTGYIDIDQYRTGIQTLGICTFNEKPRLTEDGMIPKEIFVDEAYEAELDIFNDLIKRRLTEKSKKSETTDSNLGTATTLSMDQAFFIPSGFFKPIVHEQKYGYGE